MYRRGGEEPIWRRRRRHMCPVPDPATSAAPSSVGTTSTALSSPGSRLEADTSTVSFLKDGRKIQVGDCALFQAGNAPPFIGIIRWFTRDKEDSLKLCVNWLYRPADLKLAKGILPEAAPNEVFYSFHKDVISAVSLLHPCKVAFLRKGVELPSGISSFVCRRVYDITNKCLWWLTDHDYINERQEEVDHLLDRTRVEMHAAIQSGGKSPKPLNTPTSTQQVQSSGTSFPSQTKGKKRERSEQGAESVKRERPTKTEDTDHASYRLDNLKSDIAKLTDKGALVTTEGVEKLVHLMQLVNERKIDLVGRVLLADVIAVTDKIDLLSSFVQLKGLSIFDDWLQEAHKGKAGDGSSPKECDKSTEELLLALLRALGKLPVNLTALQTCNIGKSVNNLRSLKNLDIQKKARSLVEIWKKRVDAEITKGSDVKSVGSNQPVTWPVKPGFSEAPQAGSRWTGTEAANKTSVSKLGHADATTKPTVVTPPSVKLELKSPSRGAGSCGTADSPLATVKEEKSSSSSQSQNNSHSCSSDHAKAVPSSSKEDARSSTAGSVSATKTSGGSSRPRRSNNGFLGSTNSGVQKDTNTSKSGSITRSTLIDKPSKDSGLSCERTVDMPGADHGNGHRFIIRLPNPGRSPARCSPARSANGGSVEDTSNTGTGASSPGIPDKLYHVDRKTKVRGDARRSHISADVNAESCPSNGVKEETIVLDEGGRSLTAIPDDEHKNTDEAWRGRDVSKAACSTSAIGKGVSMKSMTKNSFSSMNALVESCAKYSESSSPLPAGDDIGMKLLASVAAGEMSKSGVVTPSVSPGTSPVKEAPCAGNGDTKSGLPCEDDSTQGHGRLGENTKTDHVKHGKVDGLISVSQELREVSKLLLPDSKSTAPLHDNELYSQQVEKESNSCVNFHKFTEIKQKDGINCENHTPRSNPADMNEGLAVGGISQSATNEKKSVDSTSEKVLDGSKGNSKPVGGSDNDLGSSGGKLEQSTLEESLACTRSDQVQTVTTSTDKKSPSGNRVEALHETGDPAVVSSHNGTNSLKIVDERKSNKFNELETAPRDSEMNETCIKDHPIIYNQADSVGTLGPSDDGGLERKHAAEDCRVGDAKEETPSIPAQETDISVKLICSRPSEAVPDKMYEAATSAETPSARATSQADVGARLDFDLNEGFPGDDVNQSESVISAAPVCSTSLRLPGLPSFVSGSLSNWPSAPITVAAPAKGPFVPPENLLKHKGEHGWKGSAATSAFRPAEPRKVMEMPLNTNDVCSFSVSTGKQGHLPFDIDLNVPDERVLEDMASHNSPQTTGSESGVITNREAATRSEGGLDLDLNRADEGVDNGQFLSTTSSRLDVPLRPFSGGFSNGDTNMFRNFDLNNGPGMDDSGVEPATKIQFAKSSNGPPFLPPVAGLRMSNTEMGNVSSWFPQGNSYPAIAIPSFLHDRREQPYPIVAAAGPQRILGSVNGGATFSGDVYRGPVLSSSPAMAFSPASPYPYAGFSFGASFPLPSTSFPGSSTPYVDLSTEPASCFPTIPSQFVGTNAAASHYPRPYMVSLPEGSTSTGSESTRKWAPRGLDLNSGPGTMDTEMKDDRFSSASRQLPMSTSQAFLDEQARLYHQMAGSGVKRKEREGGPWDERFYKQSSWQ